MVEEQHFERLQDKSVSDPRPLAEREWGGAVAYGIEVNNTGIPITDEPTEEDIVKAHVEGVKKREAEAAAVQEEVKGQAVVPEAAAAQEEVKGQAVVPEAAAGQDHSL